MTVEELNVKITADALNFRTELVAANNAVDAFKANAVNAGNEVTAAFRELITTVMNAEAKTAEFSAASGISVTADTTVGTDRNTFYTDWKNGGMPSLTPSLIDASRIANNSFSRTASILDLDRNETVIGAMAGGNDAAPVNITTTVELDGDKVGESVSRYSLRRNKITNGMYR